MLQGGARPNLFECELFFPTEAIPTGSTADTLSDATRFLIKAAGSSRINSWYY